MRSDRQVMVTVSGSQSGFSARKASSTTEAGRRTGTVESHEDLGQAHAPVGLARQREVVFGRKPGAAAVLLPLVPGEARRPHDVGHRRGLAPRRVARRRAAEARPAVLVLRPEPVEHPAERAVALRRAFGAAFQRAPCGRPRQRQDVVVEVARALAFGRNRRGEAEEGDEERAHFLFSPDECRTIYADDFPEIEDVVPRDQPISRLGKDMSGDAR
jgi:hypothetical protein